MKYIKESLLTAAMVMTVLAGLSLVQPGLASANPTGPPETPVTTTEPDTPAKVVNDCTKAGFFGLKPWYQYIGDELSTGTNPNDGTRRCDVKCFNIFAQPKANDCGQTRSDIPLVLLAIVDDMLRIAGIVAVAFVIVGAFKLVNSQGNPDKASKAQETLVNALAGLAIAIVAVAFVSFIGNKLGN